MPKFLDSLYIMSMLFTLLSYQSLTAQETALSGKGSTPQTPAIEKDRQSEKPRTIQIELPADPAFAGALRKIADALAAENEKVEVHEAGATITDPLQIEAELRLNPELPFEVVAKLVGNLTAFGIARVQLGGPVDAQNWVIITAPADTSWQIIKKLQSKFSALDGFKSDIRVRSNNERPTPVSDPKQVQEPITHLEQEIKVFTLQHIAALEAQKIIVDLFGNDGMAISAEQRTNTLVVRGQPGQNAEIEVILMRLDEKPQAITKNPSRENEQTNSASNPLSELSSSSPNTLGSPIEVFRRRLNDLEKPVLQLAEKLRSSETSFGKDHPDSVKLRADLRALVQQSFVARQEIQRAELVEFSRRLNVMQQTIDARDRIAEKIVDRRIEELLDPNLKWTQQESKPRATEQIVSNTPSVTLADSRIPQKQTVSLTLFEVTDPDFMRGRVGIPIQVVAPNDLDEQIAKMLNQKTAKVIGTHAIATTLNQRAFFRSGGELEVPSPTPLLKGQNICETIPGERRRANRSLTYNMPPRRSPLCDQSCE